MHLVCSISHPDIHLRDHHKPHERFIEWLTRDIAVRTVVTAYDLGSSTLRTFVQGAGVASTADQILKRASTDEPATVSVEEDAMNRIHALFTAFDHLDLIRHMLRRGVTIGSEVGGNTPDHLSELETRRHETPGLPFFLAVDGKIRKKIALT